VEDALARSAELMALWDGELREMLPEGAEIFDAHVHLGHDIDGMVGIYEQLEGRLDDYGISRCFMFCMDEHDRHPAFRVPNDRTLAAAERSGGRMIPFVRLDLNDEPVEEAVRCLDRGAKGIKLHPRAQRFALNDERLAPVFELAAERKVPILIHGGRGLPPIADNLSGLVDRYPAQLIIAHAGIADLAALARVFAGREGVFFDTSVWSPIDLLDFFRQFSPEQVVYASDYPYGQQPTSLLIALRTARLSGFDDEQIRAMLAGNANRIADGEAQLPPTPATGSDTIVQPIVFARIHQYLSMATPMLWTRQGDTVGALGLALNACDEHNGHHDAELEQIRELLLPARELWRALAELEDETDRRDVARVTFRLIHLADIVAVTTGH
jgi:predicted TIM-barrel fold metal-dependent hydrolase